MKFKYAVLSALGCLLCLCGCKDEKPQYGAPLLVKVFGVMGRADLARNMKLGLYANEPIGIQNVQLTLGEGAVAEFEKDIRWAFDQSASTRFFIYAPYDPSFTGQEIGEISVPTDQSSRENILKCNILTSTVSGSPKEAAVNFKLEHAMTLMMVSFDNRTGQRIKSLKVNGFRPNGEFNLLTGKLTATGNNSTITPLRAPDGTDSFCFIYIPQDASPQFDVELESGKTLSIAYNNYCHEHAGSVILMDDILLTESLFREERNQVIKDMDGVNTTQWTVNAIPEFQRYMPYINLNQLGEIEPYEDEDNFFAAYLNKVTVTAVDKSNPEVKGVVIEDSTSAVHVWTYYDSPLEVGNTIVGPVLGIMDKKSEKEFYISYFYTDYATISKTDSLPCTVGTVASVLERRSEFEYRRMLFRDVRLKKRFDSDRAIFEQGTAEFSVICPDIDSKLTEGVTGDLLGFPVWNGQDFYVMVYDSRQFYQFGKEAAANAFTRQKSCGLYDISTSPDTAYYSLAGMESRLQFSVTRLDVGHIQQIANTGNGEVHFFYSYDLPLVPTVGHEYNVAFNVSGNTALTGCTMSMECIKVEDGLAWLIDRAGSKGLIMAL